MPVESGEGYFQKEQLSFGDKCGVIAITRDDGLAPYLVRKGLPALQHRGQEAAGIAVFSEEGSDVNLNVVSGSGLVPQVLTPEALDALGKSDLALGHVRYATSGKSTMSLAAEAANAQPFSVTLDGYKLSLAHNGNLTNPDWFKDRIFRPIDATSDSAYLTEYLIERRPFYHSWEETFQAELPNAQGAFCVVAMNEQKELFGFRDPMGMHPFHVGAFREGGIVLASESVALTTVGAEYKRPIGKGEILKIEGTNSISSYSFGDPAREKGCLFERFYFMRPDSFDGDHDQRIRAGRELSGRYLADRITRKIESEKISSPPESVIPIFDSGYPAAKGTAAGLGLPMEEAVTTSHYVGRTFIQPAHEQRIAAINGKHSFTPEVDDQVVLFVDDSNVRANTAKKTTVGLRDQSGASSVHAGFSSPPVEDVCYWGVDLPEKEELPASKFAGQPLEIIEQNMAEIIGAESVTYLPIAETALSFGATQESFCTHCFTGIRPDQQEPFPQKERVINGKPKLSVLISGEGSNLQEIINSIQSEKLDAELIEVISNIPEAKGLERAKENDIATAVLTSQGVSKDVYGKLLANYILSATSRPDIVVLAGFMRILSDEFLEKMTEEEITVINLHPAILPKKKADEVMTSKGKIPALRGKNVIEEAYNRQLRISGVTVHQLVPNSEIDSGPVILRQEVPLRSGETLTEFVSRMHEAEHETLPAALNRVIHVIKHNIDVSKGNFPW